MDYIIGSLVTVLTLFLLSKIIKKENLTKTADFRVKYSQSHVFEIVRPYIMINKIINKPELNSQASKFEKSLFVRVIFVDNQAYWIKDDVFYTADVNDEGFVDNDTTRAVDTMTMDKVQLDKMIFIVDKLTEGT